jgi:uncharacterized protein
MLKFLVLLLVIVGVGGGLWMARRGALPRAKADERLEPMVACAHCGLHVPAKDAVMHEGRSYCGVVHRDLGPAKPQGPAT